MFKCEACKKNQEKGQTQFKITKRRPYIHEDGFPGQQISKETNVCFTCFKKDNK